MDKIELIFQSFKDKMLKIYPEAVITLEIFDDDYVIYVNGYDIFHSEQYGKAVIDTEINIIWPQDISNLHFSYKENDDCSYAVEIVESQEPMKLGIFMISNKYADLTTPNIEYCGSDCPQQLAA